MNVSMSADIRHMIKQAAISTAAHERDTLDDSAWVVRAICEKLHREWGFLGLGGTPPEPVVRLASRTMAAPSIDDLGGFEAGRAGGITVAAAA